MMYAHRQTSCSCCTAMKKTKSNQPFLYLISSCALFFISAGLILCAQVVVVAQTNTTQVKVGVVLDLQDSLTKACLVSMDLSLSDFYASHPNYSTRLVLRTRDSHKEIVGAAASALDLIKNEEVQAIVGPENSWQANFVISLGNKSRIPIITTSATSPSLTSIRSPYFVRATLSDSSQVQSITSIIKNFGWREVVPIYVDDTFGEGIIPYLVDDLQRIGARVPYRSMISPSASDDEIALELYKLMTKSTRVFIVHMLPHLGYRLFAKAKGIGMMNQGYAWIVTDGMTRIMRTADQTKVEAMQGVLGVRTYVPKTKRLEDYRVRWKMKFQREHPHLVDEELNVFGLWAYDAITALAMAVQKAGTEDLVFDKKVSRDATDLEALGVSQYGPKLLQALSNVRFEGLAGRFELIKGELRSSTYQIINLSGNGEKVVGFWTPRSGLGRELDSTNETTTPSKGGLLPIIWPGDTTSAPKGWEIPINGKKLRVGVPVKGGFQDFVKVTSDTSTNKTRVTGFCIDVFEAVLKQLPYAITPEYIPFGIADGEPAGSYDGLVRQVHEGIYDAAVGDITIVADRSELVDFTLPYTESGVSMVVPLRGREKNTWVFLKPWTWDLWLTSACFFVFVGFVVWILEHRINEDFRGPPHHQVGTAFWFSFSTMVFSNRERVLSNLGRFVVIVWFCVVLILTQSYTASLTSLLTVQQLQPAITNVNDLIKNRENVGYLTGSFVLGILKELGFHDSNLKAYDSPETFDELFKKGTASGGIAAAFDEMPYIQIVLGQYCSKYTTVEPTFKTDGFGFAFPRGSPLVPDVSKAILRVTQGEKMKKLESAWFKKQNHECTNPNTSVTSNRLRLSSFWGLFLIAGVACMLALLAYVTMFLYEHRQALNDSSQQGQPFRRKLLTLLKIFNDKDLSSHTFRKNEGAQSVILGGSQFPASPSTSQHTPWPPSPTSFSCPKDSDFSSAGEHKAAALEGREPDSSVHGPCEGTVPVSEAMNQSQLRLRALEATDLQSN